MKSEKEILEKIKTLDESKKELIEELNGINSSTLVKNTISVKAANDFIFKRISECNAKIEVLNWIINKE